MRHVVTRDRPHLGGRARVDVGRLGRRLDRGRRVEEVADAAERLEQQRSTRGGSAKSTLGVSNFCVGIPYWGGDTNGHVITHISRNDQRQC